MGFLARVGYTNPSSDDSEDDDEDSTSDLNATVDEAWINNNAWIKPWEANGKSYAEADKGDSFGFIAMTKHEANVEIEEGAEETSEESTIGQAGMGRVINGIDAASEQALYSEMRETLGTPWEATLRHVVAISVIGGCLLGSWLARDYAISVAYVIMAAVTAKAYIGE